MSKRKDVMLCYDYSEKRVLRWEPPWIVQPKLNGDRCRAKKDEYGWKLYSSYGNIISSVPHINKQLERIPESIDIHLDGELYVHGMKHQDIRSIVSRTVNLHPNYKLIRYLVFDVISDERQWLRSGRLMGLSFLKYPFTTGNICHIKHSHADCISDINKLLGMYIELGHEGIILRNRDALYQPRKTTDLLKLKLTVQDWFKIVGIKQEMAKDGLPKQALGAFYCSNGREPGLMFGVGTGPALTRERREDYWQNRESLPLKCTEYITEALVKYQELSKDGIPIFPVLMEVR